MFGASNCHFDKISIIRIFNTRIPMSSHDGRNFIHCSLNGAFVLKQLFAAKESKQIRIIHPILGWVGIGKLFEREIYIVGKVLHCVFK